MTWGWGPADRVVHEQEVAWARLDLRLRLRSIHGLCCSRSDSSADVTS